MSARRTLVLVHHSGSGEPIEQLVAALPWAPARGLEFVRLGSRDSGAGSTGELQQHVAQYRELTSSLPIGVITDSEPNVLAALSGGADDALCMSVFDAAAFVAFLDRVELRARLRADGHSLHETFAHAEKLTALGTLVAGIGHEINNPLSVMLLSIEAARRYLLPACEVTWELGQSLKQSSALPAPLLERLQQLTGQDRGGRDAARIFDDIRNAGNSIASVVRDLRVFARTDQEEAPELVGIEEIIDQALRLTGRELFAHALIERDYAGDLPKLVVPRNRITQVLINLLVNAAHAIRELDRPAHRIRISARTDDEFLAIAVSDTGPGIPPESLERIFDPFFTTKRQELGTGLGLSISRAILHRLGGDLSVESVYGDGATFVCFVPLPTRVALSSARRKSEPALRRVSTNSDATRSVLVVDDDERMLRSYVRLLNPLHRLLIAQDVGDAIDLLESGSMPDAVLLELDLPGSDGRKLLAWLAEHRPELHRRALVVTSAAAQSQYETFLRTYAGPVLHKPVQAEQLLAELTRLLA